MNPDQNKNDSWKLIREIQKRALDNVGNDFDPSVPGELHQPNHTIAGRPGVRPQFTGSAPSNSNIKNQTFLKLALLGIVVSAFLMPLMTSKVLVVIMLLSILLLCGCCYFQLSPQAARVDSGDYETLNFLKHENEELQDMTWELREREERYRSLSDAFGDMIMDRKSDGTITYLNSSFTKFLNLTEAELIGKPFPYTREQV